MCRSLNLNTPQIRLCHVTTKHHTVTKYNVQSDDPSEQLELPPSGRFTNAFKISLLFHMNIANWAKQLKVRASVQLFFFFDWGRRLKSYTSFL